MLQSQGLGKKSGSHANIIGASRIVSKIGTLEVDNGAPLQRTGDSKHQMPAAASSQRVTPQSQARFVNIAKLVGGDQIEGEGDSPPIKGAATTAWVA